MVSLLSDYGIPIGSCYVGISASLYYRHIIDTVIAFLI